MNKIKEVFGNFFKWLVRFIINMIPYALLVGMAVSFLPKFTETRMSNPTMGFIYLGLFMLYLVLL